MPSLSSPSPSGRRRLLASAAAVLALGLAARPALGQPGATGAAVPAEVPQEGPQEGPRAEPATPTPAATAPRVAAIKLTGSVDRGGRLEGLVARLVPIGSYFVEPGPADESGAPVATEGRLRALFERLGYGSTIKVVPRPGAAEVELDIALRAADRVRHLFILGNWPLRQEDILRRLTLRPGQALPDPGPEREARIERERQSVLGFLRDQGYLDARVTFELRNKRAVPSPIEIVVRIVRGEGYPIGPITVEGNRALNAAEIAEHFRHNDWRWLWQRPLPIDRNILRVDVSLLRERYRSMGYVMARVTDDFNPATSVDPVKHNVRLRISILERKRVEIAFEGNQEFSESALREAVTIYRMGSYNSFETQKSAEAIEALYRGEGHLFVKVTWRADGSSPDVHRIVFTIYEGPSLKVREVVFDGNVAFTDGHLADVVTVKEFPFLGFIGIGEGGYASLRQLELDVERLRAFYEGNGYPGTQVRCEIAPRPEAWAPLGPVAANDPRWTKARGLYVRFAINEAPRVDVAEVNFEVAPGERLPVDVGVLRDSLDGKSGRPYRPEVVRSDAERLRRLLGDQGYPLATVEPLPVDRDPTHKELRYQIRLGPPQRIGPLFVRGNFFTTEATIRRWTELREGDPLTVTALERARRNLALIQILNNPNPVTLVTQGAVDGVTPVLVEVEERHDHLGMVRVGGGASTEQSEPGSFPLGAYAALGYEHRNLFGQSWLLLSRAELGRSLTRVNSDFTNPRLLASRFRLQLTGSYLRQSTVRLGDLRSGGGTLAIARELTAGVDLSLYYSLRSTVRTEFLLRGAGPDVEQETVAIGTMVGALGMVLEWQRLDSPLVPTRGFKLQAGIELARPELSLGRGEDTFVKASIRTLNVVPLSRRVSLRSSLRYDQGFPLGGASLLPKVERFFAGGDTTLRGFELDRARTDTILAESYPNVPFPQHRPLGGSLRILQNLDLQVHILGPWFAGVFIDSGVVADAFDGLRPATFRHGAGIAPLIMKLPIGDLSIAWGWPLDPQPGDSTTGRLHFNVGLMF